MLFVPLFLLHFLNFFSLSQIGPWKLNQVLFSKQCDVFKTKRKHILVFNKNQWNQWKSKSLKTAVLIFTDFQYQSINCYWFVLTIVVVIDDLFWWLTWPFRDSRDIRQYNGFLPSFSDNTAQVTGRDTSIWSFISTNSYTCGKINGYLGFK